MWYRWCRVQFNLQGESVTWDQQEFQLVKAEGVGVGIMSRPEYLVLCINTSLQ